MSEKSKAKSKSKIIRKPNPLLYYPLALIVKPFLKLKARVSYDTKALRDLTGPALVVCPHVSNLDFLLVACALLPHRPTFIVSQHFMVNPKTRWILEKMHVIPKKMFCPDIKTILSIMRAKEYGNIVVIFPEGRLSCFGHSLQVTDGTAELVKKLGVDVYCITENGAYKTLPKWGKAGLRKGRVEVTSEKLLSGSQAAEMSLGDINAILDRAILHDEDKLFTDTEYKCKAPALGLDGILYKCPQCLSEFKTVSDDHHLTCTACGLKVRLDTKYRLHFPEAGPFTHINDWYFWQEEVLDLDAGLETDCLIGVVGPDGNMDKTAGSGRISINRDSIHFEGMCSGQPLEFTEPTSVIKGFPASVGDHFDLYSKKILYYIMPQPDKRTTIKWVSYLDKLTRDQDSADAAL